MHESIRQLPSSARSSNEEESLLLFPFPFPTYASIPVLGTVVPKTGLTGSPFKTGRLSRTALSAAVAGEGARGLLAFVRGEAAVLERRDCLEASWEEGGRAGEVGEVLLSGASSLGEGRKKRVGEEGGRRDDVSESLRLSGLSEEGFGGARVSEGIEAAVVVAGGTAGGGGWGWG
jgi:hypothetical protein